MIKSVKLKLKPNIAQRILLAKHIGSNRFVWNYFLNRRKEEYTNNKKTINYYTCSAELTQLKKQEYYKWLKEVNSQSLQQTLKDLETAYNRFFKRLGNFPKFKSKDTKNSFRIPQFFELQGRKLKLPKIGLVQIQNRKFECSEDIKFITISRDVTGYYASITFETDNLAPIHTGKMVGIDLGIKNLAVCSDGTKISNGRYTKSYARLLRIYQKHLSRKQKGSNKRLRAKYKVAKIHKKISNSRLDATHKFTTKVVRNNDLIVIEDLNVKGMVKNRKLSKAIQDVSFGEVRRQLEYKSQWYGKLLIKIDRFFPSSKSCNKCNYINQNLTLSDRDWECPQCAEVLDRDLNASKNILKEGLRNLSLGTSDYTLRADVNLNLFESLAMKSEAQYL